MTPHRISSTQINTFMECPRKWALGFLAREEGGAGKAAAVGSIFHAIQELRLAHPTSAFPTLEEVKRAPGNYSTPAQIFAQFGDDALWPLAVEMAEAAGDPNAYLPDAESFPVLFVEYDLDTHEIPLLGGQFTAGGYLDLLLLDDETQPTVAWIGDWKTRGASSFKTRPQGAEFDENKQLAYYAAAVSRAFPSVEQVIVRHINVLRPSKASEEVQVAVEGWAYSRARLDAEWAWLEGELCPAMAQVRAEFEAKRLADVATDATACYKYGACPYMRACRRADAEASLAKSIDANGVYNPLASL